MEGIPPAEKAGGFRRGPIQRLPLSPSIAVSLGRASICITP